MKNLKIFTFTLIEKKDFPDIYTLIVISDSLDNALKTFVNDDKIQQRGFQINERNIKQAIKTNTIKQIIRPFTSIFSIDIKIEDFILNNVIYYNYKTY